MGDALISLGKLPNMRDLIIPDPGFTIVDMDLNRADLWPLQRESGDVALYNKLMEERRNPGNDIHTQNAFDLFGSCNYLKRRFAKVFCHGADYGAQAPALSKQCGITIQQADKSLMRWFSIHPGIKQWQVRIREQILRTGEIANKFGFRIKFFGRREDAVNQALAWVPASTVAIVVHKAMCNIEENLGGLVQVLINGHDSLTMQTPTARLAEALPLIETQSRIIVPYSDPLIIPLGFSTSEISWGQVKEIEGYAYQF